MLPRPRSFRKREQVLCLDQLLHLSVLMEALCPPGALAEPVLPAGPGEGSVLASVQAAASLSGYHCVISKCLLDCVLMSHSYGLGSWLGLEKLDIDV